MPDDHTQPDAIETAIAPAKKTRRSIGVKTSRGQLLTVHSASAKVVGIDPVLPTANERKGGFGTTLLIGAGSKTETVLAHNSLSVPPSAAQFPCKFYLLKVEGARYRTVVALESARFARLSSRLPPEALLAINIDTGLHAKLMRTLVMLAVGGILVMMTMLSYKGLHGWGWADIGFFVVVLGFIAWTVAQITGKVRTPRDEMRTETAIQTESQIAKAVSVLGSIEVLE
jgi:hypothetical protein